MYICMYVYVWIYIMIYQYVTAQNESREEGAVVAVAQVHHQETSN